MNRLRILKQRAARGRAGIVRLSDGWYAAHGRGFGDCYGPVTRREAIQIAARMAIPSPRFRVYTQPGQQAPIKPL